MGVLADHLLICQSLSHHYLPILVVPPDKEDYFVCLLACCGTLICYGVGALSLFLSATSVFADHLLVCQSLSHHHLSVLAVPLDKEDYFVCLLAMALLSAMVWVLSLSLFLSLMVCT